MPSLPKFKEESEIPEQLRDYYIEKDGEWVPDVTGFHSALDSEKAQRKAASQKVEELSKQLKELQGKFEGIDPEAARQAQEALERAEIEKLEAEKKFQEAAELKYKNAISTQEKRLEQIQQRMQQIEEARTQASNKYLGLRREQELGKALISMGADPEGLPGLLKLVQDNWTWEEIEDPGNADYPGRLVMKRGDQVEMGADPTKPITPKEYLTPVLKEDRILQKFFLSSGGGGTTNNGLESMGAIVISKEDAHDNRKFMAAKEQAEKAGMPFRIAE